MIQLEYTLQKYSDCIPVTKATNCNPLGNCTQSEYFAAVLFDYLILQAGSKMIYLITYLSVGQDSNLLCNYTTFICALNSA